MITIPLTHALIICLILFFIGLIGILIQKNIFFILLSLEIIMQSIAISFIFSSHYWKQTDGYIMYIICITLSAVETSINLGFLLLLYHHKHTLNINIIDEIHQ